MRRPRARMRVRDLRPLVLRVPRGRLTSCTVTILVPAADAARIEIIRKTFLRRVIFTSSMNNLGHVAPRLGAEI